MLAELQNRIAALEAKLNHVVRVGVVKNIYPDTGMVRVTMADADGLLTYELPVLVPKTTRDKYYRMPDVDEHVLCVFLPSGLEQGFVVGAFYSSADAVPASDADVAMVEFKDGTTVVYDRSAGVLTVDCVNQVEIVSSSLVRIRAARIFLN